MKTEIFLDDKQGTITTTKDLIRTQIARPLNNRELEEKIDSLCEVLKKIIMAIGQELGSNYSKDLLSNIKDIQKDLN